MIDRRGAFDTGEEHSNTSSHLILQQSSYQVLHTITDPEMMAQKTCTPFTVPLLQI